MIDCQELNKSFETKAVLFKALKENEKSIIDLKKSKIIETKDNLVKMNQVKVDGASKAFNLNDNDVCAIINTTMYMDSHGDVHINGLWEKSIDEQYGRIFYVNDHCLDIDKVIIWKDKLSMFTQLIDWSMVGKNYTGQTQALVFKFNKADIMNEAARTVIEKGLDVENSVRMQYVKVCLAVNSMDEEYKENKAHWDEYIDSIANKDEVIEQGYCWIVKEAKIANEGSMVLFGSNDATSIITPKDIEPSEDTQTKEESADSSHEITEDTEEINRNYLHLIN